MDTNPDTASLLSQRVAVSRPQAPARRARTLWGALGGALVGAVVACAALAVAFPDTAHAWVMGAGVPARAETDGALDALTQPGTSQGSYSQADLEAFFASFDKQKDGKLQMSEARAFFAWTEKHIAYRFDDEDAKDPGRFAVGDGRPGSDYLQTPLETFNERMGDCEDQNGLELAFYAYWRVPAYLAYVNAKSEGAIDHAVALVRGAATLEDFRRVLGEVPYYEAKGRAGVVDGYYFIIDNTYSDDFGDESSGIQEGRFVVHKVSSFSQLYGMNWQPELR